MRAKDLKEGLSYIYRGHGAIGEPCRMLKVGKFRSLCMRDNKIKRKWNYRIVMSIYDYEKLLQGDKQLEEDTSLIDSALTQVCNSVSQSVKALDDTRKSLEDAVKRALKDLD